MSLPGPKVTIRVDSAQSGKGPAAGGTQQGGKPQPTPQRKRTRVCLFSMNI